MNTTMNKPAEPVACINANVTEALIKVQANLAPLKANATSHHGKFANLGGVMSLLQPHLENHKLAIIQRPVDSPTGSCKLETILRHQPTGKEITITIPMQRQNDPQAFGAAMTYGRRYALLCLFGMVTEDDNADSASYTLEKLLRELSTAANLDELIAVRERHVQANALGDRFWSSVYKVLFERKHANLARMADE
jgi:hypothetical protein